MASEAAAILPRRPAQRVLARWRRRFADTPWAAAAELAARLGYVARGVVYLSIGLIALLAALGLAPHPDSAIEALSAWARWPLGVVLLWLIGLGLYGFAGWRALQALFDVDSQGNGLKAFVSRLGQALSGLIYGSLAVSVFGLIDTLHHLRHAEDENMAERVAKVMAWPLGPWVVIALGLFIVASGVGNAIRAVGGDFGAHLKCAPNVATWACRLARVGYFGRGVAMLPVGIGLTAAGRTERAAEAHDLGDALWTLHGQVFGDAVLALVSMGVIAFGAFAFVEAWHRPIRPEAALEP